jgi:hypothetical protein
MGSSLRRAQSMCRQSCRGSAQHGRISKFGCVHARAILVEGAMGGGEGVENPPSDSVYSGPALTRCRFPFHICDSANAGLSKMKENA